MKNQALLFAIAAISCATPRSATPTGSEPGPGVSAFNQQFAEVTRRMDTPALLELWEEDGISLLPASAGERCCSFCTAGARGGGGSSARCGMQGSPARLARPGR